MADEARQPRAAAGLLLRRIVARWHVARSDIPDAAWRRWLTMILH